MSAVTVVIPCKTDGPLLQRCLEHLERQTFRDFDTVVVPDDAVALAGANVRVIASGPVLPNAKRALAAAASDAPVVAFIDDDAYPDPHWLANALAHFADDGVVACGGPAITPATDNELERASGAVFASPLVTASTRFRYVPEPRRDVGALPSCNLLIRREAFLRDAAISAGYWPGEDLLTCLYATRNGERIVYDPAVLVYHHRRTLFAAHLRQVWAYGFFRGHFVRHFDRAGRNAAYLAPASFALAHIAGLPLLRMRRGRNLALSGMVVYVFAVALSAQREARDARVRPGLVAAGIYLTHLIYGSASIAGWFGGGKRAG